MIRPRTHDAAKGKWKGILLELGFPMAALSGKNCPCPMCGGKDRFRFDNQMGEGSYICGQCGAGGNGWRLLEKWQGWDFKTSAAEIDKVLGNVRQPDQLKRERSPSDKLRDCVRLWEASLPITRGDPVERYLTGRGCPVERDSATLRYHPSCPVPNEPGARPAMIAAVKGPSGRGVTLHRTFLRPDGQKADMANPRATMPGDLPEGSAVRLSPCGEVLGIAEGIETALRAGVIFKVPTWAALNATMLAKFTAPEGVRELVIFGDADAKFGGQAAAYACAHRNAVKGIAVRVEIPKTIGTDWADQPIISEVA